VSLSMRIFRLPTGNIQRSKSFFAETREEVKTLFTYGTKQIVIVAVVAFSQWLIQRKIVLGSGGSAENAIYSVGNQVFNIVTFFPTLLGPVIVSRLAAAEADTGLRRRICIGSIKLFAAIALIACICTFFGLRVAVLFLPDRYTAAVVTGTLAAVAAAFQIIKAPFSLYFLSELRTSREIASAISGAVFMIAATSLFDQLHPNAGTIIRLLGCILQAALLALFFTIESRTRRA
jgi:O-antigen/teichoic acid export membrane protein